MTPRARWTFWALVVAGVLAMGALSRALEAEPRPITGLAVAGSALAVTTAELLALRMLLVVGRQPSPGSGSDGGDRSKRVSECDLLRALAPFPDERKNATAATGPVCGTTGDEQEAATSEYEGRVF